MQYEQNHWMSGTDPGVPKFDIKDYCHLRSKMFPKLNKVLYDEMRFSLSNTYINHDSMR